MAVRYKEPIPTESTEQIWLFEWAAQMAQLRWPILDMMYHIPNEGKRSRATGGRMRAEGLKKGMPDVCLPAPRFGYHGLYIEMKRQRGGKLTDDQREKIRKLRELGYRVEVCKGFQAAANAVEAYMMGHMKKQGLEDDL